MNKDLLGNFKSGLNAINDATKKVEQVHAIVERVSKEGNKLNEAISDPKTLLRDDALLGDTETLLSDDLLKSKGALSDTKTLLSDVSVKEERGGNQLDGVLSSIDNVDIFSRVNTAVLSITDEVGILYYLKKMVESLVESTSLLLTMKHD